MSHFLTCLEEHEKCNHLSQSIFLGGKTRKAEKKKTEGKPKIVIDL